MANKYLHGKWLALWIVLGVAALLAALVIIAFNQMQAQSFNEDPAYWVNEIAKIEDRFGN